MMGVVGGWCGGEECIRDAKTLPLRRVRNGTTGRTRFKGSLLGGDRPSQVGEDASNETRWLHETRTTT